jgi:hypothetical protein
MFVVDELTLQKWQPSFSSSGQDDPSPWTRMTYHRHELSNSLEWAEWSLNSVQTILCDACGHRGCASGDWVYVSRLCDLVLWSPPQPEKEPEFDEMPMLAAFKYLGAIAFPAVRWNALPAVPRAENFPPANHLAIADAWILGPARSTSSIIEYLREKLVGGDTFDKDAAISLVERHRHALLANGDKPFAGDIVKRGSARLETLYFEGAAELNWPAFAFEGNTVFLALGRDHITKIV